MIVPPSEWHVKLAPSTENCGTGRCSGRSPSSADDDDDDDVDDDDDDDGDDDDDFPTGPMAAPMTTDAMTTSPSG